MANKIPSRGLFGDIPHEVYEYFRGLGVELDNTEEAAPDLTTGMIAALADTVKRLEEAQDSSELLSARLSELNRELLERDDNDAPNFSLFLADTSMNVLASGTHSMSVNQTDDVSISTATGGSYSYVDVGKHIIIQSCSSGMVSKYSSGTFHGSCSFSGGASILNSTTIRFETNDIKISFSGTTYNENCKIYWQLVRIG